MKQLSVSSQPTFSPLMSSSDSGTSSDVQVPSEAASPPLSSRPESPKSQSDSDLSAKDIPHPPSDPGAPRTPPPLERSAEPFKEFKHTPVKTNPLNLNPFSARPLANQELRPSIVNPFDTMSRWRQFSIDSWMDKFCPGSLTTLETLPPLPKGVTDELKEITREVLSKYFTKEDECFDTLGKEAKMYAPIVSHHISAIVKF